MAARSLHTLPRAVLGGLVLYAAAPATVGAQGALEPAPGLLLPAALVLPTRPGAPAALRMWGDGESLEWVALPVRPGLEDAPSAGPSTGAVVAAAAGGLIGSLIVGGATYSWVDRHASDRRVKGDAGYSPTANWSLLASSALGSAVGIEVATSLVRARSSFPWSLFGSAVATTPFLLGVDDPYLPYYVLTLGAVLQSAAGTLGGALPQRSVNSG